MKGKPTNEVAIDPAAAAAMDQLLSGDDNSPRFDFGNIKYDSLGRLAAAAAKLGLLWSCYYRNNDGCFVLSVRAGERKRTYQAFDAQELHVLAEGLIKTLSGLAK